MDRERERPLAVTTVAPHPEQAQTNNSVMRSTEEPSFGSGVASLKADLSACPDGRSVSDGGTPIRVAGIVEQSIVDGPGLRLVVFTQGCPHGCPGCHSPQTHDFDGGTDMPVAQLLAILDKNPLLKGITFSGGEPLVRVCELLPLAQGVRERGKDIVCFTGFTFEELLEKMADDQPLAELLGMIDLLVDGRYIQEQRDLTLPFRGSKNQRLLDLPASLAGGEAVMAIENE